MNYDLLNFGNYQLKLLKLTSNNPLFFLKDSVLSQLAEEIGKIPVSVVNLVETFMQKYHHGGTYSPEELQQILLEMHMSSIVEALVRTYPAMFSLLSTKYVDELYRYEKGDPWILGGNVLNSVNIVRARYGAVTILSYSSGLVVPLIWNAKIAAHYAQYDEYVNTAALYTSLGYIVGLLNKTVDTAINTVGSFLFMHKDPVFYRLPMIRDFKDKGGIIIQIPHTYAGMYTAVCRAAEPYDILHDVKYL